jgi:hypothetical protein
MPHWITGKSCEALYHRLIRSTPHLANPEVDPHMVGTAFSAILIANERIFLDYQSQ